MRVEIPNQISVKIGGIISRGVKAVEVTDEGKLIFTLTDGSTADLGSVIGPAGPKGETGPAGPAGPAGAKGDTGAAGASIASIEKTAQSGTTSTYTITMSDGQTFEFEVQSDKGEKGDKGDTGATGPKGPQGEQGPAGIVVQETEPTGTDHPVWVNPKGGASDPGILGKDGTTFTPSVSASGDLSWTNDGGKENPETVNIKGPQGEPGEKGDKGDTGSPGAKGDTGATPNLQIGTVTTLPAGSDATASMGGTAENPLLNLGIPQGANGGDGSSTITTATETDIAGLLMGEGGKVRKAVPDVDYRATKELPTPTNVEDSGKYLRWYDNAGWVLDSANIDIANLSAHNGQIYCDLSPSAIQSLATAGRAVIAQLDGEPYLLTSVSDQSAVFTRVAGMTVDTITVSSDYTAVRTTTTIPSPETKSDAQTQPVGVDADGKLWTQPGGGSSGGGADISLGVTGAAVGQLVKITEVDADGKPTAWEAFDPAKWTKIGDTINVADAGLPVYIAFPDAYSELIVIGQGFIAESSKAVYAAITPGASNYSMQRIVPFNIGTHVYGTAFRIMAHNDTETETTVKIAAEAYTSQSGTGYGSASATTKFKDMRKVTVATGTNGYISIFTNDEIAITSGNIEVYAR